MRKGRRGIIWRSSTGFGDTGDCRAAGRSRRCGDTSSAEVRGGIILVPQTSERSRRNRSEESISDCRRIVGGVRLTYRGRSHNRGTFKKKRTDETHSDCRRIVGGVRACRGRSHNRETISKLPRGGKQLLLMTRGDVVKQMMLRSQMTGDVYKWRMRKTSQRWS